MPFGSGRYSDTLAIIINAIIKTSPDDASTNGRIFRDRPFLLVPKMFTSPVIPNKTI